MRARSPQAFLLTFYHMMCRGRDMKVEVDAPRSSRNVTWRQFKDFLTVFFYLQLAVMAGKLLLTRGPIISGVLALVLTKPVRVMLGHNVGCFLCDYYLQVPPAQTRRPCATNRAHGGARAPLSARPLSSRCSTRRSTSNRIRTNGRRRTTTTTTTDRRSYAPRPPSRWAAWSRSHRARGGGVYAEIRRGKQSASD